MRSHPIWHEVNACNYRSSKSYGSRDTGETAVYVGTSASNSELLVRHCVTRREDGPYTVFRFFVDTGDGYECVKRKWMHTKRREWFDEKPVELEAA